MPDVPKLYREGFNHGRDASVTQIDKIVRELERRQRNASAVESRLLQTQIDVLTRATLSIKKSVKPSVEDRADRKHDERNSDG